MKRLRAFRILGCGVLAATVVLRFLGPVRADTPPAVVDIWTWGANNVGQLGGVPANATLPSPTHEVRNWVAVSAGNVHTIALTATGEVWAWGRNTDGQLGNGSTADSMLPIQVQGLSGITLIAAGGFFNLAYRAGDATLWAWGSNAVGQLAQPSSITSSSVPVQIAFTTPPSTPITALAAGGVQGVALTADGSVYSWGGNAEGELGLGDFAERRAPELVALPRAATSIGAGASHTLASLGPDGQVYAWGWNVFGQLGRGVTGTPTLGEPVPAPVLNVTDAVEVSAGDLHCLARTADGHVWAWGYNTEGQVGNGPPDPATDHVHTPVLLDFIDSVTAIEAGGLHSLALRANGEVFAWGNGQFGACGNNARRDNRSPVRAVLTAPAMAISGGGRHTVALAAPAPSHRVVVLGPGGVDPDMPAVHPALRDAKTLGDVVAVSSGWRHTLVLDGDHRVWAFGDNTSGQLGFSGAGADDPVVVDLPLDGAAGFVEVGARANQSFALRSDGIVWAWGAGTWGQLGIGVATAASLPTQVPVPEKVVSIAIGERHGLALDRTGAVWAWGQNLHGELGVPPTDALTLTPALVPYVIGPSMIAAGGFHSLAINLVGGLVAWGSGYRGQLGVPSRLDSYIPVEVAIPHDVTTLSAGRFHTLAVRTGGQVFAFGDNTESQIADTPLSEVWPPTAIRGPVYATVVQAGDYHSLALDYGGGVHGWGNDSGGQLGRSDPALAHADWDPARVPLDGVTALAGGLAHSVMAVGTPPAVDPADRDQ